MDHRISALIAGRDRHNALATVGHESLPFRTQMGVARPRRRVAIVLRRANRGRADRGHAALDGRRARRRAATARHARIRGVDGRARAGRGEVKGRSGQIASKFAAKSALAKTALSRGAATIATIDGFELANEDLSERTSLRRFRSQPLTVIRRVFFTALSLATLLALFRRLKP